MPPTEFDADRRRELGLFLRSRRERTRPSDVGLPESRRRRTPGLRREEIAVLAGISTTWYTFLEQGRDVRASDQVLTALGNALRLDDGERAHLISLSAAAAAPLDDLEYLAPQVAAVPRLVEPQPAYITGISYDLLAWNGPAAEMLSGALPQDRPSPPASDGVAPNLARWMFLDPRAREILPDWVTIAQGLLARLRANVGKHPGVARFQRLEHELRNASREADAWWDRYDIATSHPGFKQIRDSAGRVRTMSHASFQVPDQPDQVLTIYSEDPPER